MNKLLLNLLLGLAATGFVTLLQAASNDAKAAYYAAADKAAADYRDAHAACEALDMSMQSVCIEEAKLAQTRAKMNAEAHYRNTAQARQQANMAIANAEFAVAKARCEIRQDNEKNVCIKQAEATRVAAIKSAKASQKTLAVDTAAR